jgi:hypothetical protein
MTLNNPQKHSILIWLGVAITILILCSSCESDIDLPYNCLFNTLPNWCKVIVVVESIVLNILILAMIITFFLLKYQIKKLENGQ